MSTSISDSAATTGPLLRRLRPFLTIAAGIMILAVFGFTLYEFYIMNFGPDAPAYSYVVGDEQTLAAGDARGAFLEVKPSTTGTYASRLIGLLETETPGVIDASQAVHVLPGDLDAVLIRQSALADPAEYRVYPLAGDVYPMAVDIQPNGVLARIHPQAGAWQPGNYIVDIPANGTFGGREYYAFVVDPPAK